MSVSVSEEFPKKDFSRADVERIAEQRRSLPRVIKVEVTEDTDNWIITTTFNPVTRKRKDEETSDPTGAPGTSGAARKGRNQPESGDWFSVARVKPVEKAGGRGITGWRPSPPDMRDFSWNVDAASNRSDTRADKVIGALRKLKKSGGRKAKGTPPSKIDISKYCAEIEQQGDIGSCTAHAVVGLVEYFMRRSGDPTFEGSRRFVYKTTRRLAGLEGDTGAQIRTALGAAVLCGTPPEKNWPYTDEDPDWDEEPDSFTYSLAQNFQALRYFRYDTNITSNPKPRRLLDELKEALTLEIPIAFGFYGFPSFDEALKPGDMPFPSNEEKSEWGHAVMAVGYDDDKKIEHPWTGDVTTGALKIRNSWGRGWGKKGYGWMPYDYVLYRLADDFWSIIDMEWVETNPFDN